MSATEELRRMLDERGVEYETWDQFIPLWTSWESDGHEYIFDDFGEHTRLVCKEYSPEQAIVATLGDIDATGERQRDAGTCTVDVTIKWDWDKCGPYWEHELSCGHVVTTLEPEPPRFCPNCGRKVVSE